MDIEFEKITDVADIPLEIKDLYLSSFPEEERREWGDIERRINEADPVFSFYVLKHVSENIGFITLWRLPGALYCEHFAIFRRFRGNGYGAEAVGKAIRLAREQSSTADHAFILEVELPETSDDARRRIAFYERCGMIALDQFPYWQPPYRRDLPEVPMMIMSSRPIADPASTAMILHTVVYNQ